jgi:hypothetical protein
MYKRALILFRNLAGAQVALAILHTNTKSSRVQGTNQACILLCSEISSSGQSHSYAVQEPHFGCVWVVREGASHLCSGPRRVIKVEPARDMRCEESFLRFKCTPMVAGESCPARGARGVHFTLSSTFPNMYAMLVRTNTMCCVHYWCFSATLATLSHLLC